jgi:5,10-methylene-tetrahydrofolate dehydrogenase/methenyl tetrahydrofolate cyclohydrolase
MTITMLLRNTLDAASQLMRRGRGGALVDA